MKWSQIRRMAISLPLAMLAAIAMVAINEVGYQRSNQALEAMAHTQSTRNAINHLMQNMLDAETGLRGYLLTSDERYLEPYNKAITSINGDMDQLRELFEHHEAVPAWEDDVHDDDVGQLGSDGVHHLRPIGHARDNVDIAVFSKKIAEHIDQAGIAIRQQYAYIAHKRPPHSSCTISYAQNFQICQNFDFPRRKTPRRACPRADRMVY